MKYDPIPLPREHDVLVMMIIMSTGMSQQWVSSLNRCWGYLGVLFLSDMSIADGNYLEQFTFDPHKNSTQSVYKFPKERPTTADWKRWDSFWADYTMTGRRLRSNLGKWINPTHRTWQWYYNKSTNDLMQLDNRKLLHYKLDTIRRTR